MTDITTSLCKYAATLALTACCYQSQAQINFDIPPHPVIKGIAATEYAFDVDPGIGNGQQSPTPFYDFTANTSSQSAGMHSVYIRAKDSSGRYSHTALRKLYVATAPVAVPAYPYQVPQINRAEYFVDIDPGIGNAAPLSFTPGVVTSIQGPVALTGLADSVHFLFTRVRDENGRWSQLNRSTFAIVNYHFPPHAAVDSFMALEYFFDNDPGLGNGTLVTIPVTAHLANYPLTVTTAGLADTLHTLFIRTAGDWSHTQARSVYVGTPLPVTWLYFNATRTGNAVMLDWKVNPGKNDDHYVIERSSDGKTFDAIGKTAALPPSGTTQQYAFTDNNPLPGISYYRLQQTDHDGQSGYSPVLSISANAGKGMLTLNNPVKDMLIITGGDLLPAATQYTISHISGRMVKSIKSDGSRRQFVPVTDLPAGHYQLTYTFNHTRCTNRFIKE